MNTPFDIESSPYTKRARAFLATHKGLGGTEDELFALHVQLPLRAMLQCCW